MAVLDPFYGISNVGTVAARWMNRFLLVGEVAVLVLLARLQVEEHILPVGNWVLIPAVPLSFALISLVNSLIRQVWNIILVVIYGTTDPDQIAEQIYHFEGQQAVDARRRQIARGRLEHRRVASTRRDAVRFVERGPAASYRTIETTLASGGETDRDGRYFN